MFEKNKIKDNKILFLILPILAIAFHFFATDILMYSVYYLFLKVLGIPKEQFMKFSYLAETLVYVILIFIFFAIYRLNFKKNNHNRDNKLSIKDAVISLIAGVGVSGFSFLWTLLADKLPILQKSLESMNEANKDLGNGSSLGIILIAVVAAPLIEEILFRGIVFQSIKKVIPLWMAVAISSVLFGAYHMNIVQAVYATFMGVVAAIIYEKKNNLIYPILVHVANNFVGAIQSFIISDSGIFVVNMICFVMLIPTCYIIYELIKSDKIET